MEELEKIKASAAEVVEKFGPVSKIDFGYNKESVRWLEGYIERLRKNGGFEGSKSQFIGMFGSYLGECIVRCYGGHWENRDGDLMVAFDAQNWVLPFNKVRKQWENGLEDGIGSLFEMIPIIWSKQQHPKPAPKPKWKFW
jgi:hypothetical protein